MEVATGLSVDQAIDVLLAAMRKPRGFSIMAHRKPVGSVSRDRVILRRGIHYRSKNYGEFQGRFVEEQGLVKLQGKFVAIAGSSGRNFLAEAELLIEEIDNILHE